MIKKEIHCLLVLITLFIGNCHTQEISDEFPILTGPYLGQKPPGMIPEVFAPGILANGGTPFNSAFSPDGNEFYYSVSSEKEKKDQIWYTERVNNIWSKPEIAPFSGQYDDCDVSFSPDGQRLFFISLGRPLPGHRIQTKRNFIWFIERRETGCTDPQLLEYPGNRGGVFPVSTANKTLYFSARLEESFGSGDIYRSRWVQGVYKDPENLGPVINSKYGESDAHISMDESFLIFTRWKDPDNTGGGQADLYISFSQNDGSWSKLVNLGPSINTDHIEFCPSFSPDGEYFFFSRFIEETNDCNIYWVDAKIIEDLKPEKLP